MKRLSEGFPAPFGTRLRVARRTFAIFAVSAVIPTLLGAAVAYHAVQVELESQMQKRLMENARSFGLGVFTRLTAADQMLLQIAESAPANPALAQSIFASVSILHSGEGVPASGRSRDSATLAAAEAALKGPARDSTVVFERDDSQVVPVLVRRLTPAGQAFVVGRMRTDYLWGDTDQLASETQLCIRDRASSFNFCSQGGVEKSSEAGSQPAARAQDELTVSWPLYLRARFGIDPLYVSAGQPRVLGLAALSSLRATLIPLIVITLALVLLFGAFEIRRIFRPLELLLAAMSRLAHGDFARAVVSPSAADGDFHGLAASINLTAVTLGQQSHVLNTLSQIDRKILTADSVETVIALVLPSIPAIAGCSAALLLTTNEDEGEGMLYSVAPSGTLARRPCKLEMHSLQRVVEEDAVLQLSDAAPLPFASLREAGFHAARTFPVRDGTALIGALVLLDPPARQGDAQQRHALDLADRLSVAISHARSKQDLLRNAYFDPLTGLANRELFCDRIGQALGRDGRRRSAAVLLIGIDRFKNINDTLGHRAGDELLKLTAERLRAVIGVGDTVARLIGDEFIVLMSDLADPGRVVRLAEQIETSFTKPFLADGIGYVLSASIGIAIAPGDGLTPDVLIRNADIAMRRAKNRSVGAVVFFEETMNEQAKRSFRLEHGLRAALEQGEIEVHFQPKIELRTGRVIGGEALLRWTHPSDGAIPPAVFIPIAEETGLIIPLGYWVVEQACRHLIQWRAAGLGVRHVAVNLSLRQLRDPEFVPQLARLMRASGLPAGCLELEVTESTIAEHAHELPGLLQQMREHGIRIAIDDFGTGYSSLSMLRLLPIDVLKIDRAFVSAMEPGGTGEAIAGAIIAMGQVLGKELVAEGVETAAQAQLLEERGCRVAQGFHFSKALPPAQFAEFCRSREIRPVRMPYASTA